MKTPGMENFSNKVARLGLNITKTSSQIFLLKKNVHSQLFSENKTYYFVVRHLTT